MSSLHVFTIETITMSSLHVFTIETITMSFYMYLLLKKIDEFHIC